MLICYFRPSYRLSNAFIRLAFDPDCASETNPAIAKMHDASYEKVLAVNGNRGATAGTATILTLLTTANRSKQMSSTFGAGAFMGVNDFSFPGLIGGCLGPRKFLL
jgi:hypothetical protein